MLASHVLDDIFVHHQIVGHAGQRSETHVDFRLTRGRNFMVVGLDLDAESLHRQHHLAAQILHAVDRRSRKISLFLARLVAQVRRLLCAGVPGAFL